jgi:hypothetical protein
MMRISNQLKERFGRWVWVCPLLALALAAAILLLWGVTFWTAIGVALLLVCPAIIIWAMLYFGRDEVRDKLLEDYRRKRNS